MQTVADSLQWLSVMGRHSKQIMHVQWYFQGVLVQFMSNDGHISTIYKLVQTQEFTYKYIYTQVHNVMY